MYYKLNVMVRVADARGMVLKTELIKEVVGGIKRAIKQPNSMLHLSFALDSVTIESNDLVSFTGRITLDLTREGAMILEQIVPDYLEANVQDVLTAATTVIRSE